jgi:hypothetical protein
VKEGEPVWATSALVASVLLVVVLAVLALAVLLDPIP